LLVWQHSAARLVTAYRSLLAGTPLEISGDQLLEPSTRQGVN
jgi:hypothetical protein